MGSNEGANISVTAFTARIVVDAELGFGGTGTRGGVFGARGANPRFIATSLMGAPQWLKSVNSRNIRARPKFS